MVICPMPSHVLALLNEGHASDATHGSRHNAETLLLSGAVCRTGPDHGPEHQQRQDVDAENGYLPDGHAFSRWSGTSVARSTSCAASATVAQFATK